LVWVDGVPIGNPSYNHFRADIAALFPGLANSNGVVGFRVLDTTTLTEGLHTVWRSRGLVPGNYDLGVFAWSDVSGGFVPAQVVRITAR
jgi:hypothetical protein